jgi:hypothetical protein
MAFKLPLSNLSRDIFNYSDNPSITANVVPWISENRKTIDER